MKARDLENLRIDPETVAVLNARARKARSEFVHGLVVRLVHRLTPRIHLRRIGTHWG